MVMPFALAALQASRVSAAAESDRAGVMPVQWNQVAPSNTLSQSISPTCAVEMEEYLRS